MELRRFRVRTDWNRCDEAGVWFERHSSCELDNAIPRLPYRSYGFGQHGAARGPLAHHSAATAKVGGAGVLHATASQSRGSERGVEPDLSEKSGACAADV